MANIKTWKYDEHSRGEKGVNLDDNCIGWWEWEDWLTPFAGGYVEQSYADFLKDGPYVTGVPEEIVTELRAMVSKLVPQKA